MTPGLRVSDERDDAFHRMVADGLSAFNAEMVGYSDHRPLDIVVTDPDTGAAVGGICGRTSLGLLFVDLVYLPPFLRGGGVGARMLAMAEEEARRRGCRAGFLLPSASRRPSSTGGTAGRCSARSRATRRGSAGCF